MNKYQNRFTFLREEEPGEPTVATPDAPAAEPASADPNPDDIYTKNPNLDDEGGYQNPNLVKAADAEKKLEGGDPEAPAAEAAPTPPAAQPGAPVVAAPTVPAAPQVNLSPEAIQAIAAAAVPAPAPAVVTQPAPMTTEEMDKILKPVKVTSETLAAFGFEEATEAQVQAFQNLADGISENAFSRANVALEFRSRSVNEAIAPVQEYIQAQQAQAQHQEFYGEYPALETFQPVVAAVAKSLNGQKPDGSWKTNAEVKAEVVQGTVALLQQSNITIDPKAAKPSAAAVPVTKVPAPQARTVPGRSGGDQSKTKNNNPDADIYSNTD